MLKRKMIKNFTWPLKTATREIEVTRLYPEFMMNLPAAERGIHELDATICIGCGTCARVCPNSCIEMVNFKFGSPLKNKKMQFPQIDYGRCMFCGLCVDECPVECLKMGKRVTMAGWNREDIVKGPDFLATRKFSAKEVADLEAEAKRMAAKSGASVIRSIFQLLVLLAALGVIFGGLALVVFLSPWSQTILSKLMA